MGSGQADHVRVNSSVSGQPGAWWVLPRPQQLVLCCGKPGWRSLRCWLPCKRSDLRGNACCSSARQVGGARGPRLRAPQAEGRWGAAPNPGALKGKRALNTADGEAFFQKVDRNDSPSLGRKALTQQEPLLPRAGVPVNADHSC